MKEQARKLSQDARKARDSGDLIQSGNLYTAAAHEHAGTVTEHIFPETDRTRGAVSVLGSAALCYRIAGDDFRTQNRCDMGILLAEDYLEYIERQEFGPQSFGAFRRGAWPEFIGDLRTIAQRENADKAYDRAHEIYASAGDYEISTGEQEHMRLTSFFESVRRGLGHDISNDALELQPMGPTMTDWLEYKRERLPAYLDQLEAQGEWPLE